MIRNAIIYILAVVAFCMFASHLIDNYLPPSPAELSGEVQGPGTPQHLRK